MNLLSYSLNLTKKEAKPKKTPIQERLLLVTIIVGMMQIGGARIVILWDGEDGVTLLSLLLNMSSSVQDNDASSFA
jgi:hypothetical protein